MPTRRPSLWRRLVGRLATYSTTAALATVAAAGALALDGCSPGTDSTAPSGRPATARVAVSATVGPVAQSAGAGAATLQVAVSYLHAAGDSVPLGTQTFTLNASGPQQLPVTVDLASCLNDPARRGASTGDRSCVLRLDLTLLQGTTVLDRQAVFPITARPGETANVDQPVTLYTVAAVTITAPAGSIPVPGGPARLSIGQTLALTAGATDAAGNAVTSRQARWSSDNAAVATVDSVSGVVTPVAPGRATITAVVGGRGASLVVNVIPAPAAITVGVAGGAGTGTVTSAPEGISCTVTNGVASGTCSFTFQGDAAVTLTAVPAVGSSFSAWGGDCATAGTVLTCTLSAAAPRNATVTFVAFRALNVALAGDGGGAITSTPAGVSCTLTAGPVGSTSGTTSGTCSAPFLDGNSVTLTAAATATSTFAGWGGACAAAGAAPTCTVTLTGAQNVTATFTRRQLTLTLTVGGSGSGAVTATGAGVGAGPSGATCTLAAGAGSTTCTVPVQTGATVTLTASAGAASSFGGWAGACASTTGTTCTLPMSADASVGAVFTLRPVALSITPATGNTGAGTISTADTTISCAIGGATTNGRCAANIPVGTSITLRAAPAQGQVFLGWGGACASAGTTPSCTFTVGAVTSVTAAFGPPQTLTLTLSGTGGGTVTGASSPCTVGTGAGPVTCTPAATFGSTVALTATPDSASTFAGWTGACSGTGACPVTLDQARAVGATFTRRQATLTLALGGSGTGRVSVNGTAACTLASGQGSQTCTQTVDAYSTVSLTGTALDPNTAFTGWGGTCPSGAAAGTCTFVIPAAGRSVAAVFTASAGLTVGPATGNSGAGTITFAGNTCGIGGSTATGTCSARFDLGTQVTLTAAPAQSQTFLGWGGACASAGTTLSCTVTVNGALSVTAAFGAPQTLSLTLSGTGGGTVTGASTPCTVGTGAGPITCTPAQTFGSTVNLTATADSASTFTGWTGACTGTGACSVTLDQARAVGATFTRRQTTLAIALSGSGAGRVSVNGTPTCTIAAGQGSQNCQVPVDVYSTVTLTGTATDGSTVFIGWGRTCPSGATTGACTFVVPPTGASVAAVFTAQASLSVSPATGNSGAGTVTFGSNTCAIGGGTANGACSATYAVGTQVTLTAAPAQGQTFLGWGGACAAAGSSGSCTITINGATSVTVAFGAPQTLTLTLTGSGGGTVTGASTPCTVGTGAGPVTCTPAQPFGSTVTLTATPDSASTFAGWTGACTGTGTCTVTLDQARAVAATFSRRQVTLTLALGGSGAGSVAVNGSTGCTITAGQGSASCPVLVDLYSTVTLTGTASGAGTTFDGWGGTCPSGATTGPCTFVVTGARSVAAVFTGTTSLAVQPSQGNTGAGSVTFGNNTCNIGGSTTNGICSSTYPIGTSVTLTAAPAAGQVFLGWGSACAPAGTSTTCTVTVTGPIAVTAAFGPPQTLSLTLSGTGGGTVSGASTTCTLTAGAGSTTCTPAQTYGSTVTLTATPDASSSFTGWGGACTGTGTCTVTMTQARTVTAGFQTRNVNVTLALSGSAGGNVLRNGTTVCTLPSSGGSNSCTVTVPVGTALSFTAQPTSGSQFNGWAGPCSGTGACSFTATTDVTVGATFVPVAVGVTVTADPQSTGNGTVTSTSPNLSCTITGTTTSGTCASTVPSGSAVSLTATPSANFLFVAWGGACAGQTGTTCTLPSVTTATSVSARFAPSTYTLNVTASGTSGGSLTTPPTNPPGANISCSYVVSGNGAATLLGRCSQGYPAGATATITATPDSNSVFAGWSGDCAGTPSTSTTCTLTMSQARNVGATFATRTFTLRLALGGAGAGSVSRNGSTACSLGAGAGSTNCSLQVPAFTAVTLTAGAASGSSFSGWGGACASAGTAANCTYTATSDTTVGATFVPAPVSVTVAADAQSTGNGNVTSNPSGINCNVTGASAAGTCSYTVASGSQVTLTANTTASNRFVSWGGACAGQASATCTLSNVTAAASVTARFAPNTGTLAIAAASGSTGQGSVFDTQENLSCQLNGTTTSGTCSHTYGTLPATVTLRATNDQFTQFLGWSGVTCPEGSSSTTCTVTVTGDVTVSAGFRALPTTTVTPSAAGTGQGTLTVTSPVSFSCILASGGSPSACQFTVPQNATVAMSVAVDANTASFTYGGACAGQTGTNCSFTASTGNNPTVTYTPKRYQITAAPGTSNTGTGTITSSPAGISCTVTPSGSPDGTCFANFNGGSTVTFTQSPAANNTFVSWGGSCASAGTNSTCTLTNLSAAAAVTANYRPNTYQLILNPRYNTNTNTGAGTLTAPAPPGGGSLSCFIRPPTNTAPSGTCANNYPIGSTVTITATPDNGSGIESWTGACAGTPTTSSTCTVTMNQNQTAGVNFGGPYSIGVASPSGAGAPTPTGVGTVTGTGGISCALASDGSVSGTCAATYNYGTAITYTASPDSRSYFAGWITQFATYCGGVTAFNCSFTATGAGTTRPLFNAATTFELDAGNPESSGITFGTILVQTAGVPDQTFTATAFNAQNPRFGLGNTVTLTARPTGSWVFTGWQGDCQSFGRNPVCTLTNYRPVPGSSAPTSGIVQAFFDGG